MVILSFSLSLLPPSLSLPSLPSLPSSSLPLGFVSSFLAPVVLNFLGLPFSMLHLCQIRSTPRTSICIHAHIPSSHSLTSSTTMMSLTYHSSFLSSPPYYSSSRYSFFYKFYFFLIMLLLSFSFPFFQFSHLLIHSFIH